MTYHLWKQRPLPAWLMVSCGYCYQVLSKYLFIPLPLPPPPLTFRFLLRDAEGEPHLPPPSSAGFLA